MLKRHNRTVTLLNASGGEIVVGLRVALTHHMDRSEELLISELRAVSKDRGVPEDDLASWSSGDFLRISGGGDGPLTGCLPATESISLSLPLETAFRGRFLTFRQRPPGAIHTLQFQIPLPAEHSRPHPIKVGPVLLRSTLRREYIKCHVCHKDIFKVQCQQHRGQETHRNCRCAVLVRTL